MRTPTRTSLSCKVVLPAPSGVSPLRNRSPPDYFSTSFRGGRESLTSCLQNIFDYGISIYGPVNECGCRKVNVTIINPGVLDLFYLDVSPPTAEMRSLSR